MLIKFIIALIKNEAIQNYSNPKPKFLKTAATCLNQISIIQHCPKKPLAKKECRIKDNGFENHSTNKKVKLSFLKNTDI